MGHNLQKFIDYLNEQAANHSIYVWGGQGQNYTKITESWIKSMETSTTNANRAIAYWKKQIAAGYEKVLRAYDCSGLGMYYLQNLEKIYSYDMSSNTMMKTLCTSVTKANLKKGDWVFRTYTSGDNKGNAYHIGYVVDDALNVVESKGRDDGVTKRSLNANGAGYWNAFGRPKVFKEEIENTSSGTASVDILKITRKLKLETPYMRGDDVLWMQTRLTGLGYSVGTVDGVFGSKTKAAVQSFQKAKGLVVDGVAGESTITALGGIFNDGNISVPDVATPDEVTPEVEVTEVISKGWDMADDGEWYYKENSSKVTGWKKIDGKWYYFGDNGAMQKGWLKYKNYWYYLDDGKGHMITGWHKTAWEGKTSWYIFDNSSDETVAGRMLANVIVKYKDGYWPVNGDGTCWPSAVVIRDY